MQHMTTCPGCAAGLIVGTRCENCHLKSQGADELRAHIVADLRKEAERLDSAAGECLRAGFTHGAEGLHSQWRIVTAMADRYERREDVSQGGTEDR